MPVVALSTHLDVDSGGQGVHHGDAHAVQAARDRVAAASELAAGMQLGHDHLDAALALAWHLVHRDATAVVVHPDAVVGQDGDFNVVSVPGQSLVDRVVDDLVDQMMQAPGARRTDVHAGTDADRLQPLQHLQIAGVIMLGGERVIQLRVVQLILARHAVILRLVLLMLPALLRGPGRVSVEICHG